MRKTDLPTIDSKKSSHRNVSIITFILLQFVVLIYTSAGIVGKLASREELFSLPFLLLYGLEIIILGVYAILWQQMIKKIDLSIAYANRSINLLWSMLFAVLIFNESITLPNVLGVVVVFIGILLVNSEQNKGEKEA